MIQWLKQVFSLFQPTEQKTVGIAWPSGNNVRLQVPDFGSGVLVVRFTTPASSTRNPSLQVSQLPGAPQVFRVATLSTQPGLVAAGPSAMVLASAVSQSPVFRLTVGTGRLGLVGLKPATTYYRNVANRDNYAAPCNCNGNCGVNVDFTN